MSGDQYESVSGNTQRRRCLIVLALLVLGERPISSLEDVKSVVVERCNNYKNLHHEMSSGTNCQDILTTFEHIYVGKDPCGFSEKSYDTLISKVKQAIPRDKTLFYSKTKKLAHAFTAKNKCKMTLEDTLLGHMLDDLTWCSKPGSKETLSGDNCKCDKREKGAVLSFWIGASANLAASTSGHASVLLSASINPPYSQDSVFGSLEVKKLGSEVHSLTVYLVPDENSKYKTDCKDASLVALKNEVTTRKVEFSCKEISLTDFEKCITKHDNPDCPLCH